jgi:hypothetical protein
MDTVRSSRLLMVGLLFLLTACQVAVQPTSDAMLEPGGVINGMSLTTGAKDAIPLWAFCSPAPSAGNSTTSNCQVPVVPQLAIGQVLMPGDDTGTTLDWSATNWDLRLDGQSIDLKSFGTFDFVVPALSHDPAPVREVFVKVTAWDVVLTNLNPGEHTIQALARMGNKSHTWVLHLTIGADAHATGTRWLGSDIQEVS